jgi:hypothetical protein
MSRKGSKKRRAAREQRRTAQFRKGNERLCLPRAASIERFLDRKMLSDAQYAAAT